jgi:hypothetical protein
MALEPFTRTMRWEAANDFEQPVSLYGFSGGPVHRFGVWNKTSKERRGFLSTIHGQYPLLTPAKERGEDLGGFELLQRFGVIFAAKECATIFPVRTTNVSVPASYMLSGVSAFQRM